MYTKTKVAEPSNAMKALLEELDSMGADRFTDKDFPHCQESLDLPMRDVMWLPAEDFSGAHPRLFGEKIKPNDIRQGKIEDSYLMSSLAILAEKPERVREIFCHQIKNTYGAYCITLFCGGERADVLVDEFFPCDSLTQKPLFSHCNGRELWVLLIEKAYAKYRGSYKNIIDGSVTAALNHLTGGPTLCEKISDTDDAHMWSTLTLHDRLAHVLCCGINSPKDPEAVKSIGLLEKHSYAILDVKEYHKNKLIHLRNPWSKTQWNGKWSDKDKDSWTDDAKRALHYSDVDDGSFWMSFEDWKRFFTDYTVVTLEEGWGVSSFHFKATSPVTYLCLTTTEQTDVFFTANVPANDIGYRFCILGLQKPHFALGGTKEEYSVGFVTSTDRIHLPAGKFLVVFETDKEKASKLPLRIVISSYSTSDGLSISTKLDAETKAAADGAEFALPDFDKKYGCCETCKTGLSSTHLVASGRKFHKCCLQCYFCGAKVDKSAPLVDGHVVCQACASGKKTEGEPETVKFQGQISQLSEELRKSRIPQLPDIVAKHHKAEEEQAKTEVKEVQEDKEDKPEAAAETKREVSVSDLVKLCKEQKKVAKRIRQNITDADIRRVFSMIDVDGSGLVERNEIGDLIIVLGLPISVIPKVKKLQIDYIMQELDFDGSGEVDFKEFRNWYKYTDLKMFSERLTLIEESAIYFLSYVKGYGTEIYGSSIKKLHAAVTEAGLTKEPYENFIRAIDKDKSGTVSFFEFIAWMDKQFVNRKQDLSV